MDTIPRLEPTLIEAACLDRAISSRSNAHPADFEAFVEKVGPRLRVALLSRYGPDRGADVTAVALGYAWEHWERIRVMENPAGYIYRVAQSAARRGIFRPRPPVLVERHDWRPPVVEPGLKPAIERLSPRQREVVVLVHGFGWTVTEVSEFLGIGFSSTKRHLERAIARLRSELGVFGVD
jgi:DNA-directed RNA polymerase specialized sigma24 family protein